MIETNRMRFLGVVLGEDSARFEFDPPHSNWDLIREILAGVGTRIDRRYCPTVGRQ